MRILTNVTSQRVQTLSLGGTTPPPKAKGDNPLELQSKAKLHLRQSATGSLVNPVNDTSLVMGLNAVAVFLERPQTGNSIAPDHKPSMPTFYLFKATLLLYRGVLCITQNGSQVS